MMNFTFSIPILLTVIGALILAIALLFDKNTRKWIRVFNFIGGLIIIIAGVVISHDQAEFKKMLTGGDSVAHLGLTITKDPSADYLEFYVVNEGDYPIRDLSIGITDQDHLNELYYEAIAKKVPPTLPHLNKSKNNIIIGTIGPHKVAQKIATATMPAAFNDRNFSINFNSLYDHYNQALHIGRNKDGKLTIDSLIQKGNKTVYSLGDTSYFQPKEKPSINQTPNKEWVLSEQGESITVIAIDGKWIAFDPKGKLVEPQQIGK